MTDDELLAAAQRGDRHAVDQLLRAHHHKIRAVCRRLAGNDSDADDATQEALLAVVRGLPRFDGRSSLSTWLYRVATNACLDELRRRQRRPSPGLPAGEIVAYGADPAGLVSAQVTLDAALTRVPEDFRVPLVLRDVCELDYAEISEVLGIPPGTVRSRIARGRLVLHEQLGNQNPVSERRNTDHA